MTFPKYNDPLPPEALRQDALDMSFGIPKQEFYPHHHRMQGEEGQGQKQVEIDDLIPSTVVTQAATFPGLHVVRQLTNLRSRVRAVVSNEREERMIKSTPPLDGEPNLIETFLNPRLEDEDGWDVVVRGATHIVHFASPRPQPEELNGTSGEQLILTPGIDGTIALLRSALRLSNDEEPVDGGGGEVASETSIEKMVIISSLASLENLEHFDRMTNFSSQPFQMTSLLPVNMCGPEVIPGLLRDDNYRIYLGTQGSKVNHLGHWVDVRDVADAACEALFSDVDHSNGFRYLISAGPYSLSELARIVREQTGIIQQSQRLCPPSLSPFEDEVGDSEDLGLDDPEDPEDPEVSAPALDSTPSIRDLGCQYNSVEIAATQAFSSLLGTCLGDKLGIKAQSL
ncbi:hypothetical protein IE53DRAFT_409837 [Violaceomyces palustris]|uniref:Uncharacterized protein n=1 Tax=Violaceomyces palustris TaxID=1673888 RepID=A0ACD0P166_9BASI|nr:hypothetical protein IE53DRAFT_409837 [Violaceomyces palustris]